MIDTVTLLAFLPLALALNLTPGADMMFCLGQGLRGGRRAALAANAGIAAGSLINVALAGAGLGAVIAALPLAFDVIRWVGVVYLLWLAVQAIRGGAPSRDLPAIRPATAFRQGLLVNLTNPKVILFILALLPQFVDPAHPVLPQFLLLGGVIAAGGFIVNGTVGIFAGSLGRRMARSGPVSRVLAWLTAGLFSALALRLALMQKA